MEIVFKGKPVGLKFNNYTVELWVKSLDAEALSSTWIYSMFYAALKSEYYVKRLEVDFTFEEVVDMVDDLSTTNKAIIESVDKEFTALNAYKLWLAGFQERIKAKLEPDKAVGNKKKAAKR